jgi:hypothetical protein
MADSGRRDAEARTWAGRLVVALCTFWTFVLALGLSWLIERSGALSGAAFTWGVRLVAAGATVTAFLLSPALARRAPPRALVPLAVGTGLSLALAIAFLFVVLAVRAAP